MMEELLPFEKQKREILVRYKAKTNDGYGKDPDSRSVSELVKFGIININKPSGPTSHQVSDFVQKILGIDKAGHSGTLDPKVTGVLPVAVGDATRIVQTLLTAGKEYVCIMHLHKPVEESLIRETVKDFTGTISQLPPIRSAVKRQVRERTIYYFNIIEINGQDVLFKVGCEAGTYIRKLVHEFGQALGVGAHMAELVRTKAGPFSYHGWVSLHDLKDAYQSWLDEGSEEAIRTVIKPLENAVSHLPKIWVCDGAVDSICHGADLSTPGISQLHSAINHNDVVAIMTLKNELVCLAEAMMNSQNMLMQEKGIAAKTKKVFMKRGTYPKYNKK